MAFILSVFVDLRMVLLGNAGVGKSSTANAILGREAFRETETTECEIQRGRVNSRIISVIDTPGINNTALSTDQLKTEIERILSLSAPGPHLFLLVIRVRRFTEDTKNTVKWIQENFGEEALKFTMVLFTGREDMTTRQLANFSEDAEILELINKCGFGYDVINSKREVNPAQITKLLEKIKIMVQQNRGQHYTPEMYEAVQRKRRIQEKAQEKKREEDEKQEQVKYKEKEEKGGRPEEKQEKKEEGQTSQDKMTMTDDREKSVARKKQEEPVKGLKEKDKVIDDTFIKEYLKKQEERQKERERRKREELRGATGGILPDLASDLRIVLLGTTGSGISASGNTILGREAFETDLLNSTTKCKRRDGIVRNDTITVIDTKGIPLGAHFLWLRELFQESLSMCSPGPHVFLLVIRSPINVWSQEKIGLLKENFGEEFVKRCIVLLTHGDMHGRERHVLRVVQFQRLIRNCSGIYHIFNNEEKEDRTQVTELLEKIEILVVKNRGQHYTAEMFQEAQRKNVKKELESLECLLDMKMQLMILAMHREAQREKLREELEKIRVEEAIRRRNQQRREQEESSCHLL